MSGGGKRRFLAIRAEELAKLNQLYRARNPGQNLPILDARSSQILLVASSLEGDEKNPTGGKDPSPLVFVKGARYEKLMEAFGGVGVQATTPAELRAAMEEALRSRRPTLINALIDEGAGTESGRITALNPTAKKK